MQISIRPGSYAAFDPRGDDRLCEMVGVKMGERVTVEKEVKEFGVDEVGFGFIPAYHCIRMDGYPFLAFADELLQIV